MKKARRDGFVYQPTYVDKRTGERKTASRQPAGERVWWGKFQTISGVRPSEILNVRECHVPRR
jgi:hypothetical protein